MGKSHSRVEQYLKLTQNQRTLIRNVWIGIENNPQFHGSVFFMGFCEIYPQYTKYFTADVQFPLTFDARTNAKFTVIMETMGYLLLDFHNKPKQLDYIIGYIAMIHKDMNLTRSDMSNFGISLSKYLSVTFSSAMTPESSEIISNYTNNLLDELSGKIERFREDEALENDEVSVFLTYKIVCELKLIKKTCYKLTEEQHSPNSRSSEPCGPWLVCGDNLIYGQTLDYWKERKSRWEKHLDNWKKLEESTTIRLLKISSTDDEETSVPKSKTEDENSEFVESTARLLESHGIPRKKNVVLPSRSVVQELRESKEKLPMTSTTSSDVDRKNEIIDERMITPEIAVSNRKTPRERRRKMIAENAKFFQERKRTTSYVPESDELSESSFGSQKIDSLARRRRRTTQAGLEPS